MRKVLMIAAVIFLLQSYFLEDHLWQVTFVVLAFLHICTVLIIDEINKKL